MATKGRTGGKEGKKNTSYLNRLKANSDSLSVYNKALKNQREINSIIDYNKKIKAENKISKAAYDKDTAMIKNLDATKESALRGETTQYYKDNKIDRRPSVIMNEQRVMSSYSKGDTLTRKEYESMAKKYKAQGLVLDTDTTNIPVDKYGNSRLGMGPINPKYGKNRKPYKPKKLKLFNESMRSGDVEKLKPGPPPKKEELVKVTPKKIKQTPVKEKEFKPKKVPGYLINKRKKKNKFKKFVSSTNPFTGKTVTRKKRKVRNLVTGKNNRIR